ncbi:MAG: HAMP domain-containing protein [Candidatus Omnitrophica bacterium]|nr:HAMP domain-containing protein [Candidatus Omnitrophota bacterium]MCB9720271.1 HAMP domain-containing protein [Candidatus Omnitrophota bacterium]
MNLHSIRFKLSILYTCALALLFTSYSLYLYTSLHSALIDDFDEELKVKAEQVQNFLQKFYRGYVENTGNTDAAFREAADMTIHLDDYRRGSLSDAKTDNDWLEYFDRLDLSEDRIHFFSPKTATSITTHNIKDNTLSQFLEELNRHDPSGTHFYGLRINNEIFRVIQKPFHLNDGSGFVLQIATSQKSALILLEERRDILFFSIPVILLIAVLIGRSFAMQLTKPLIAIARAAEHISYKDLNQRVTAPHKDEEIGVLVRAFNNMLNRLQKSFKHIAEFNSHVSHELKTPIAIISGECEVALRRDQTAQDYKESLTAIHAEAQKMLRITEDLLLLSKLDYVHEILKFEVFSLREYFYELFQSLKKLPAADARDLRLTLPDNDATLQADPVHLRRLFMNVIGNALKFTPAGGFVQITASIRNRKLIVLVRDSGIGIGAADLPKIFNQFYQKTPVSLQHLTGNGLGLSIAQAIVKAHNGHIEVTSEVNRGTTFRITLPVLVDAQTPLTYGRHAGSTV